MLPGGPAAKLGNRYETWCTLAELVRLLNGQSDVLRIEVPGIDKAEFVVWTGTSREAHQAKRSHSAGTWSFAALRTDGLIRDIGKFLTEDNSRFVFTSGSEARHLLELVQAAKDAESIDEFANSFVGETSRKERFDTLVCDWECAPHAAVDRLRRIELRTVDERGLQEQVRWAVEALFLAEPQNVISELRAIVEDSVHRKITGASLIADLAKRGYRLRRAISQRDAVLVVQETTNRFLDIVRRRLIQQTLVPRQASVTLLSRLGVAAFDMVITGTAGIGKSSCVIEVVQVLRNRQQPVLAFRIDLIPSEVQDTSDLGQYLGLEESPVQVLAAAAEAAGRPGVLIIDQLDAVSNMSGRSSAVFDLVERLIDEARGTRARTTIHTVSVCRSFDWTNDSRLRRLLPEDHDHIDVTVFQHDEAENILKRAGFDLTLFQPRQLALLRLPQNLSLFLEANFDPSVAPAFKTSVKIVEEYWENKRRIISGQVTMDHWMVVMETMCREVNATQRLSVPREKLDSVPPPYLHRLASEGVLTFDGRYYGFSHESFFDYCFARVFVNRTESIAGFLKASEQHLFRRSQVRQLLVYLREAAPQRYLQELESLLSDQRIRPHIKDLALSLLAEVMDQTDEEWAIWERWTAAAFEGIGIGVESHDKLSVLAWRRLFESTSWFTYADRRGFIDRWLASKNDRIVDMAMNYLWTHHPHAPDRVASLLEPYADYGGKWVNRFRSLMEKTQHHTDRRYFDLLMRLVDNGTLDEDRRSPRNARSFWLMLYSVSQSRPEWIAVAVSHYLRRQYAAIDWTDRDAKHPDLIGYDKTAERLIRDASERAPTEFVRELLPVILNISDSTQVSDHLPKRDSVWTFLSNSEPYKGEDVCLIGLALALQMLARDGSDAVFWAIAELRSRDTYVANYLLQSVYCGDPRRFAEDVVWLLISETWRFHCGFSNSPHWCTMELIRCVIPHCSLERRKMLEAAIVDYIGPFERPTAKLRREGIKYNGIGRASFSLLSAIPSTIRSAQANRYFDELARRFGSPDSEPRGITGGFVESPIAETSAAMMTDDQWLLAIVKHSTVHPAHMWDSSLKGGANELSHILGEQTKNDPERFVQLALTFPVDANPVYLERILQALRDACIDSEAKISVCRKAYNDSPTLCGKAIADVLGSIADPLPESAVNMLQWLATEHEDPSKEAWQEYVGNGQTYYNGDIYTNGINTTRGRAAEAIQRLILLDPGYIRRFGPALDRMIIDRSAAVRSCVAGVVRAVGYHDKALGMSLFGRMDLTTNQLRDRIEAFIGSYLRNASPTLRWITKRVMRTGCWCIVRLLRVMACNNRAYETTPYGNMTALDDRLLATNHVVAFISSQLRDEFPMLRSVIKRMLRSSDTNVCEAGGRLASMAAMLTEQAKGLGKRVLRGQPCQRIGAAKVATANLGNTEFRDWCKARLITLFEDDDSEVRKRASFWCDRIASENLEGYSDLIESFCNSRAFAGGAFGLLQSLEESRSHLPGIICLVCERSLDHPSRDAYAVGKLIFRTYHQHQSDEWTARILDLIDRLCLDRYPGVRTEFEQFDR